MDAHCTRFSVLLSLILTFYCSKLQGNYGVCKYTTHKHKTWEYNFRITVALPVLINSRVADINMEISTMMKSSDIYSCCTIPT